MLRSIPLNTFLCLVLSSFCTSTPVIKNLYAMGSDDELPQTILNIQDKRLQKIAVMHLKLTKACFKEKSSRIHVLNLVKDRLEAILKILKSNQSVPSKKNLFDLYYHDADVKNFLDQYSRFKLLRKETIQVAMVQNDIKSLHEKIDFSQKIIHALEDVDRKFSGCKLYSSRDPDDCLNLARNQFVHILNRYNQLLVPSLSLPSIVLSHFFNQAIYDLQTALMRDIVVHINDQFHLNKQDEISPLPTWIVDLTERNPVEVELLVGGPEKPMKVTPTQVTSTKKKRSKFEFSQIKPNLTEIPAQEEPLKKQSLNESCGLQARESLVFTKASHLEDFQESEFIFQDQDENVDHDACHDGEQLSEDDSQEFGLNGKYPSDDLYLEDLSAKELKKRMQAYSTQPESKTVKQNRKKGTRRAYRFEKAKRIDSFEAPVSQSKEKKKGFSQRTEESSESQILMSARAVTSSKAVFQNEEKVIYLTQRSIDTFERMTQSHYGEKVTIPEYVTLLKDFIELNSRCFLKKVVQLKKSRESSEVSFNLGEGESFLLISQEGQKVYFSFHYPHDHDGNNHRKVPKEYRDDYMRVFKEFQIQRSDLMPVRRLP